MRNFFAPILLLAGFLFLTGCGGENLTNVSGKVSWNNVPVAEGRIEFEPSDGKTASVAVIIENGTYTAQVPPGEKIVRLYAFKKTGTRKVDDGMGNITTQDLVTQVMPAKMNTKSELRVSISGKFMEYNSGVEL